jgi:hypothetical protein
MAYTRGNSKQIIVGAAALFISSAAEFDYLNTSPALPTFTAGTSYKDTLQSSSVVRNVGYTSNGLELDFQPAFNEVAVDQLLDAARLYKTGMQVRLKTSFAEATLDNLLVAIAAKYTDKTDDIKMDSPLAANNASGTNYANFLDLTSGSIGDCPVERGVLAVGPGTGDCQVGSSIERIYVGYRALSIDNVIVDAKRDAPSMFAVNFRLLPAANGSYGRIVDRLVPSS